VKPHDLYNLKEEEESENRIEIGRILKELA
jgi:hypothetical protein